MKQHVDAISMQGAAGSPRTHGSKTNNTAAAGWSRAGHLSARGKGLQGAEPQGRAESLFLKETRSTAGAATGWDTAGVVLQPTSLWGLNRPHLPKVQLSHKCLQ